MKIVKRDGKYFRLEPVDEGFDIDREIGKLQDEIREKEQELKQLIKAKE